jgi:hypothetical protein
VKLNATRNAEEPWLHEGAAEYLASRLWQSDELLYAEAGERLSACVTRQDRRPLDGSLGALVGATPYDCGFLIQLLAEAAALRNDQGDTLTCGARYLPQRQQANILRKDSCANGIDLFANPLEAHATMRAACVEGRALVFGTLEREELAPTPCAAVIQELPQVIELDELPVFPR